MKILFLTRNMKQAAKKQASLWAHQSFIEAFAKQHDIIWWGLLFRNFDLNIIIPELIEKYQPDIIFKYGFRTPHEKNLAEVVIPKFIYLVDYCPPKGNYRGRQEFNAEFMKKSKWDVAMAPVTIIENFVKKDVGIKETILSPFSVDIDMFKKIEINKNIDVSAMFAIRDDVYPNRGKVVNTIKSMKRLKVAIGKRSVKDYINVINRSKIFVTSNNVFGSISMKYTECMSCGTFLLADEPDDWELFGYKPGYHFVIYKDMNDLKDKINYFLKNSEEREEIAKNGMEFVRTNHNHGIRIKKFNKFVKDRYNII